jgi:hypothetical protein
MLLVHSMLLIFTRSRSIKAAIKCLVDTDLCVGNRGGVTEWWCGLPGVANSSDIAIGGRRGDVGRGGWGEVGSLGEPRSGCALSALNVFLECDT